MDAHLQRALESVEQSAGAMTPEELNRRKPGKWSAAEIVEHLSLGFGGTTRMLQWFLDNNKLTPGRPTDQQRTMTQWVIEEGNFPPGMSAPPFAVPRGLPPESVVEDVRHSIAQLDETLTKCEQTFGPDAFLGRHAALGPLTADQWRRFHLVHTNHHVKQIEELKGG